MSTTFLDHAADGSAPSVGQFIMEHITVLEIVSMFAIAAYNALEVGIITLDCFKWYRGLYFWSMQVASWCTLVHAITGQISYVSSAPVLPISIPFLLSWMCMVTGQAVVLYSRLHLVVADVRSLRWVLAMITANALFLHIPMVILFYCHAFGPSKFIRPARIFDRIQVTGFCIQDFIIGGIYIYESLRAFKPVLEARGREGRKVIYHLILVNAFVIILDIALMVTEFKAHYLQSSFNAVVYSIKLKIEFMMLTRLRLLTRRHSCMCQSEEDTPRRSSDINIFEMATARSRAAEVTPPPFFTTPRPRSPQSSTHEFHQALRETASSETAVFPPETCILAPEPWAEKHERRPRVGSTDTISTMESGVVYLPK